MDCERRHYRCDVRYHYRRFIWPKNNAEISPQLGPRDEDRPAVNGKENDDEAKSGRRRRRGEEEEKEFERGRNRSREGGARGVGEGKTVFFTPTRMLGLRLGPMICTYVEDCLWRSRQLFNLIARCYVGTVSFPI